MPHPNPYERQHGFADFSALNPSVPHIGQWIDSEVDSLSNLLTQVIDRAKLIQRDDGALLNGIVTFDSLDVTTIDGILSAIGDDLISQPGPAGPAIPGPIGTPGPTSPPIPWITGSAAPSPAQGVLGQLYLNLSNGDVWERQPTNWATIGNIRGPEGLGGGGAGVSDHGALTGLADADHPISAVAGLQLALDNLTVTIATAVDENRKVFRQPVAPTAGQNLNIGDLWFNTGDGNRLYFWDGNQWLDSQDAAIQNALNAAAVALDTAATAEAKADGKVTTYIGSTQPVAPAQGDLWFNSAQGNALYRRQGAAWVLVQDTGIAAAAAAALTAQATADGKIVSFYQTAPPSQAAVGDLWFDTDDANKPYRFNGSLWIAIPPVTGVVGGQVTTPSIANAAVVASHISAGAVQTYHLGILSTNGTTIDMQQGRVVFTNGAFMNVVGAGFGTSNQFIEWWGPALANVNLCNEAAAISYKKTNGNTDYRGGLSSDIARNPVTATSTLITSEAILGPFGTYSNAKNLTFAYFYRREKLTVGATVSGGPPSAVLILERAIAGGAYVQINTLNITNGVIYDDGNVPPDPNLVYEEMSGSLVFTDPTTTAGAYTYRGRIQTRVQASLGGGAGSPTITQQITIVCTESTL